MTVRVVTDSACDLPASIADELAIDIVPLTIRFGEEEFVDRRDLTPQQFWARMNKSPVLPETAAPSPGAFEEAFRKAAAEGAEGVVCINLSGQLSATIQSAQLAAEAVKGVVDVRVVDSRSLTLGLGNLVIAAGRAAQAGKSADDVVAVVEDLVPRTRTIAALDTLENLKKGGRIGGAQAMIGSMLSIKPIIRIEGAVEQESKQRTRSKALAYLVDKVKAERKVEHLAVVHGDAPDLEQFLDLLAPVFPRDEITVAQIGPIIGAHGGPRLIGVTYHVAD